MDMIQAECELAPRIAVVDGIPITMFPGLNATVILAKPSGLSDPLFTN
jgi:hypothetical protein